MIGFLYRVRTPWFSFIYIYLNLSSTIWLFLNDGDLSDFLIHIISLLDTHGVDSWLDQFTWPPRFRIWTVRFRSFWLRLVILFMWWFLTFVVELATVGFWLVLIFFSCCNLFFNITWLRLWLLVALALNWLDNCSCLHYSCIAAPLLSLFHIWTCPNFLCFICTWSLYITACCICIDFS